ncbi:hypothetical protein OSB04_011269 [Centaurea solstitialis]|uniref:Helitron helicase-like domain-containing protein n=1 Tax=Centaurea solstitialis TaxID=347529 RepID=A0AA38WLC8_9ASTR|nr:hypothetical protein OSB04_011269 [Centaurea solstitialis]
MTNITNIPPMEMTQGKINETTPVSALTLAQRRKIVNRNYYQRSKEKNKSVANTQGTSIVGSAGTNLKCSRLTHDNFHDIQNMRGILLSLFDEVVNQESTKNFSENTPVSALTLAQRRQSYNRNYYQRSKEKNRSVANTQGTNVMGGALTVAQNRQIYNRNYYQRRKENNRNAQIQHDDPYNFVYDGVPTQHRVFKEQNACEHCGAKRFEFEFISFCCMSGKTRLAYSPAPEELYHLFTAQSELGEMFRRNIRAYNTNFSFTLMGVTLDSTLSNMTSGVYTFRAHGAIYHRIDQLVPRDGQPRYLQLYFFDAESEVSHRVQWPNLDRNVTELLARVLSVNPYVRTFRSLAELGPLDNYRVTLNASVELDQRVYNRPTTSEVAGIWVEGNDNITAYKRSIVVYGRSDYSKKIEHYYGCYDPLAYPLFFPNGESGWHARIPRHGVCIDEIINEDENFDEDLEDGSSGRGRKTVSMRDYYCYKFQIRSIENVILLGGILFQQFVVDMYIKIETARLSFIERNQVKIRSDLYQGVVDCVNSGEVQPSRIGQRVVLPASFIGGPRDMRRRYMDAMALVQDDGKPDIFLTMMCNPNCPEILQELLPGQTPQDRPDLVARVFCAKLEDLKDQLFRKHILGEVGAYVYVIEFQKRGLPHAHFLMIMKPEYKITNADHYDKIVCAEIPDSIKYPEMHQLVIKHMMQVLAVICDRPALVWKVSRENVVLDILNNLTTKRLRQLTHIRCIEGDRMESR